jgi:murein DD-endopeptidase MepM/ murein hydrolase activator NlpD
VKILILTNTRKPYNEFEIDFQFLLKRCALLLGVLVIGYLYFSNGIEDLVADQKNAASSRLIEDQLDAKFTELQFRLDGITNRLQSLSLGHTNPDPLLSKVVRLALEQKEENQIATALILLNKSADNEAMQLKIDNTLREVRFNAMLRQINDIEYQLSQTGTLTAPIQIDLPVIPTGLPLLEQFKISRPYGYNLDPFTYALSLHQGIDLPAPKNTNILATADGIVSQAKDAPGYGLMVEIQHSNGFVTRYGHASKLLVKQGQEIKKGDVIALVGSTGRSTGNHLHYEILFAGQSIDPIKLTQMK